MQVRLKNVRLERRPARTSAYKATLMRQPRRRLAMRHPNLYPCQRTILEGTQLRMQIRFPNVQLTQTSAYIATLMRKPRRCLAIRHSDLYLWPADLPRGHAAAYADPVPKRSNRAPSYANLDIRSHPDLYPWPAHLWPAHVAELSDPALSLAWIHANLGMHSHPDAQTASPFSNPSLGSVSMASGPSSRARSCAFRSGSKTFDSSAFVRKPRHT